MKPTLLPFLAIFQVQGRVAEKRWSHVVMTMMGRSHTRLGTTTAKQEGHLECSLRCYDMCIFLARISDLTDPGSRGQIKYWVQ